MAAIAGPGTTGAPHPGFYRRIGFLTAPSRGAELRAEGTHAGPVPLGGARPSVGDGGGYDDPQGIHAGPQQSTEWTAQHRVLGAPAAASRRFDAGHLGWFADSPSPGGEGVHRRRR